MPVNRLTCSEALRAAEVEREAVLARHHDANSKLLEKELAKADKKVEAAKAREGCL